ICSVASLIDLVRTSFRGPTNFRGAVIAKPVPGVAINLYMTGRQWQGERTSAHLLVSNIKHVCQTPRCGFRVPGALLFESRFSIVQLGHSQFHLGVLLDISESGVLLHCNPPVPQGQNLEMIFVMPREI